MAFSCCWIYQSVLLHLLCKWFTIANILSECPSSASTNNLIHCPLHFPFNLCTQTTTKSQFMPPGDYVNVVHFTRKSVLTLCMTTIFSGLRAPNFMTKGKWGLDDDYDDANCNSISMTSSQLYSLYGTVACRRITHTKYYSNHYHIQYPLCWWHPACN